MTRLRLDEALVARGLYPTRSRARDAIKRGAVSIDGVTATKPGQPVADHTVIGIADQARSYVSRAALKLMHALDRFALSPHGLNCLDIGVSTGGFSEVLLEKGAQHVTAVDVGHGQLAKPLRDHPRVTLWEGLNARELSPRHVKTPLQFVVCDVSFISLRLALPRALDIAATDAKLVALIKPQFEAGRGLLGHHGVIRNELVHREVCEGIVSWVEGRAWTVLGLVPSPVAGGSGNKEFLIAAEKQHDAT